MELDTAQIQARQSAKQTAIVKWLVIGFLGALLLFLASIGLLLWKFSPLVKINDHEDRVMLLGGFIDINGKTGTIDVGHTRLFKEVESMTVQGVRSLPAGTSKGVEFFFSNGTVVFMTAPDHSVHYQCKIPRHEGPLNIVVLHNSQMKLDLRPFKGVQCEVSVPAQIRLTAQGRNGHVTLTKPRYHFNIQLMNGDVDVAWDKTQAYNASIHVMNGRSEVGPVSSDPRAYQTRISIENGTLTTIQ